MSQEMKQQQKGEKKKCGKKPKKDTMMKKIEVKQII